MTATDSDHLVRNDPQRAGTHFGRSWNGPGEMETRCPCPKAPCGLVAWGQWADGCNQHNPLHPSGPKTLRTSHSADQCPAPEASASWATSATSTARSGPPQPAPKENPR